MKTLMKTLLMVGSLGVASLLTSCQSGTTYVAPTSAVSCSKCGTVYFQAPATNGVGAAGAKGGFITLRTASRMSCPDCENKVIAWVKTGSFTQHVCKTCGGAMSHCTSH